MLRRTHILAVLSILVILTASITAFAADESTPGVGFSGASFHDETLWDVRLSVKHEALCFVNALLGEEYYLNYYQKEYDYFAPLFTPAVSKAIKSLKTVREITGMIMSANMTYLFSVSDDESLNGLLADISNTGEVFKRHRELGSLDFITQFLYNLTIKSNLKVLIEFLIANDFEEYWKEEMLPGLEERKAELEEYLQDVNVVPVIEKHLGFPLGCNRINIYLLYFNKPHGIKLVGTQYITGQAYSEETIVRHAIHEMMHPPANFNDWDFKKAMNTLRKDELFMYHLRNHNRAFGYNNFRAFFEENCVDSLEIYIAEKIGLAVIPGEFFKEHDDGMEVLGAALYVAMKEEGFGSGDESFQNFLTRMLKTRLAPGEIEGAYINLTGN